MPAAEADARGPANASTSPRSANVPAVTVSALAKRYRTARTHWGPRAGGTHVPPTTASDPAGAPRSIRSMTTGTSRTSSV